MAQWLRVLKVINPRYSHINVAMAPPSSFLAQQADIIGRITVADDPTVIASERTARANIARATNAEGNPDTTPDVQVDVEGGTPPSSQ